MKVILTPQIRENLHEPGKNQFVEENGTPKPLLEKCSVSLDDLFD